VLVKKGLDARLPCLMRHSSIKVTMDYYANVDPAVEEAVGTTT
jgi:hypothetical protein